MAAVRKKADAREYRFADEKLQTGVLDVYSKMDKSMDMFRPNLADKHKVGFFSQDRTSQTDVTEVVNLKEMTKVLRNVLGDVGVLKREIVLSKNIIEADYEARLKNKAIELYSRVNQRMSEVEKLADERIDSIRRAFRQQLSNSIHRLKSIYTAEMERKIEALKRDKLGDAAGLLDKYAELQQTNERNKSLIQMLRMQLADAMIRPEPIQEVREDVSVDSPRTTEDNDEVVEGLRLEVRQLETKMARLVEELDVKDEQTSELKMEIDNLKDSLEKEKIYIQQLKHENEEMKNSHDLEKTANKRQFYTAAGSSSEGFTRSNLRPAPSWPINAPHQFSPPNQRPVVPPLHSVPPSEGSERSDMPPPPQKSPPLSPCSPHTSHSHTPTHIEKQRLEMEREMEAKMQKMMKELSANAAGNLKSVQDAEKNKLQLLSKQNLQLQQLLAQEKAKHSNKSKEQMDMEAARSREAAMLAEIAQLKKEVDRIHRSWEKKFGILNSSLHALKDESFLRQTLQRQAANLSHAAISYAADAPLGIHPTKQTPRKNPLPNIPRSERRSSKPERDYYAYAVSAPCARHYSIDANQIISDTEEDDIPLDVAPLPDPPQRSNTSCGEETSRPPSTAHVVVVPSPLQAQ